MSQLPQALVFAVLIGSIYALMATGLTLTFGVMKIVGWVYTLVAVWATVKATEVAVYAA